MRRDEAQLGFQPLAEQRSVVSTSGARGEVAFQPGWVVSRERLMAIQRMIDANDQVKNCWVPPTLAMIPWRDETTLKVPLSKLCTCGV